MREKGQITVPADIRKSLSLSKNSILFITKVGASILLTPKPSAFEATSRRFLKAAEDRGITLENLLKDLKAMRHHDVP